MSYLSPFFIFLILPILVVIHAMLTSHLKNLFLLAASLWVYSGGESSHVPLLLLSILTNYSLALTAERRPLDKRYVVKAIAIFLNLTPLVILKFPDIVDSTFLSASPSHLPPLGISFFTFQALSYVFDVCHGEVKARKNILQIALYIALFPQLIAGPILRYQDMESQLEAERPFKLSNLNKGGRRFLVGVAKKLLIADLIGYQVDLIFLTPASDLTTPVAWLGAIAVALQIYFDLSGYTDMAIGMGYLFGFKFVENFDYPLVSRSISEFWQRWHMSLTNWFRAYLYFPSPSSTSHPGAIKLLGVFLLVGLWHGASWGFVLFGLANGLLILVEKNGFSKWLQGRPVWLGHLYFCLCFSFLAVLFRSEDLPQCGDFFAAMLGFGATSTNVPLVAVLDKQTAFTLLIACLAATPVWKLVDGFSPFIRSLFRLGGLFFLAAACGLAVIGGSPQTFLYYQF